MAVEISGCWDVRRDNKGSGCPSGSSELRSAGSILSGRLATERVGDCT